MPSAHFLLGQQTRGHQKRERELAFLEHLLYAKHQACCDTAYMPCSPIISCDRLIPA